MFCDLSPSHTWVLCPLWWLLFNYRFGCQKWSNFGNTSENTSQWKTDKNFCWHLTFFQISKWILPRENIENWNIIFYNPVFVIFYRMLLVDSTLEIILWGEEILETKKRLYCTSSTNKRFFKNKLSLFAQFYPHIRLE